MKGTERINAIRAASRFAVAALAATFALAACAPAKVNNEVLMNVKKVGILTVTIDKVGTQSTDDEVMRATVNYAAGLYSTALAKRREWTLVPLSSYQNNPSFRDFLNPSAIAQKPQKPEEGSEGSGLKGAFAKLASGLVAGEPVETAIQKENARYLAAANMPFIPYVFIGPEKKERTTKGKVTTEAVVQGQYRQELFNRIGSLAGKLGLDGFIVMYLHTAIHATVGATVTSGGRGNDTIRMAPTMILVSKDGKAAIDMGTPVIDDLTTSNMAVPLYRVQFNSNGKHGVRSDRRFDLIIDLKDPKGNVQKDFFKLTDDALKDFMKDLDNQLVKK